MRLRLGDRQHHHEAVVLLGGGDVDVLAVERVIGALDGEAVIGRGLRRRRSAAHGDHRVERRVAGIGHRHRVDADVLLAEGAVERTFKAAFAAASILDGKAHALLAERARREHEPGLLLRRGVGHAVARHADLLGGAHQDRLRRVAFRRQRHDRSGIAQRRTEVDTSVLGLDLVRQRAGGDLERLLGADLVAEHGKRGADLGLRRRRRELVELHVGEVAEIANRGHAVPREHVERIGQSEPTVGRDVGRRAHVIAQAVERELEALVGHGVAVGPRTREEVGHIGVEPGILAARRPQAEGAFIALARQHRLDRLDDALVHIGIDRELRVDRHLVDVEERQRAAHDLLRAAERIAVERGEQARHVERRGRRHRQRDASRAGHEIGEHVVAERDALPGPERLHRAPRENLRGGVHRERIAPRHGEVLGTRDRDIDQALADAAGRERENRGTALLGIERDRLLGLGHAERTGSRDGDLVSARRAFDIVEIEAERGRIAAEKEARQRGRDHDGIAHDDVARAVADLVLAPRHRHHAHRAGEGRNRELDFSRAVGPDRDNAGIERERRLGRRAAEQFAFAGIAAGADLAAHGLHAVDELAVKVAHLGGELALAEIIFVGRRRLVAGEIENADIDGGDDDARLLAGRQVGELYRHAKRRFGADQLGQVELDADRMLGLVDAEPLHADGAARHALLGCIHRPPERREHIGARAPIRADGERKLDEARLHVRRRLGDEPVADHRQRHRAGAARRHRDRHGVARLVSGLVERDLEQVRRVGRGLSIPAGIEAIGGKRALRIGAFHFEPVAAPCHRHFDMAGLVGGRVDRAVGHAPRDLYGLVLPGAVLPVPLIFGLDVEELPFEPLRLDLLPVGRGHHHVELGGVLIAERGAFEQRLHADHVGGGHDRQRQVVLDRAAARLGEPHDDRRLERPRRLRHRIERDREGRLAVRPRLRQVGERETFRSEAVVGVGGVETEHIAGEAGALAGRGEAQRAVDGKARGRRAVEEAAVERDLGG